MQIDVVQGLSLAFLVGLLLFLKQDVLRSTSNLHVVCVTAFLCPAGYFSGPVTGLLGRVAAFREVGCFY